MMQQALLDLEQELFTFLDAGLNFPTNTKE